MVQTNTGYMSDPERAERIVRRFTGTRIKEFLTPGNRKWIRFMTEAMIPREGLSEKELQDMEYLEFTRLVYSVGANSQYDWFSHDSRTEQLIYFKCLAEALIEGSKVSIPVKMFLELPLKAYYNCLDSVRTIGPLGNHFENLKECFAYKEGYTLRDCLQEKLKEIRKAWTMCIPLEQYRENIEDAHGHIGWLLVWNFWASHSGGEDDFSGMEYVDASFDDGE